MVVSFRSAEWNPVGFIVIPADAFFPWNHTTGTPRHLRPSRIKPMITDLEKIQEETGKLVASMGFSLVDFTHRQTRENFHFYAVVYREEGVRIRDCAEISAVLRPRLEMLIGGKEVLLDVSSPGIDRVLKRREEYAVFRGRGIRILIKGEKDWIGGIILESSETGVTICTGSGNRNADYDTIIKARLDDSQEVGNDRCLAKSRTP